MPFVAVTLVTLVLAHELPPGVVERAVQVTAQPGTIDVFYQFGLNEQTLREELEQAGLVPAAELTELEQQYLAYVAPLVVQRLEIDLGGNPVRSIVPAAEVIYLHHLQFQCRFRIPWTPARPETSLRVVDGNFPEMPGHYRLAVRGRGGIEARSAEAPLLVRAQRLAIEGARPGAQQRPTIEATLIAPVAASDAAPSAVAPAAASEPSAPAAAPAPTAVPEADRPEAPERTAQDEGPPSGAATAPPARPGPPAKAPPAPPVARVPLSLIVLTLLVVAAFTIPLLLATARPSRE